MSITNHAIQDSMIKFYSDIMFLENPIVNDHSRLFIAIELASLYNRRMEFLMALQPNPHSISTPVWTLRQEYYDYLRMLQILDGIAVKSYSC